MHTVQVLRQLGTLRDTIIALVSDNGYMLGEHRVVRGKRQSYEPTSRVPLVVSAPRWPSGKVVETPVGLHDLAPAILRAAGVWRDRWPPTVDGINLRGVISERANRQVLLEAGDNRGDTGTAVWLTADGS